MAVVGVANLAIKVASLDRAIAFYRRAGATIEDRQRWRNGERVDVTMGELHLTLFTKAIYEDDVALPDEGFLHVALFTDDLDSEIEGHDVVWGPDVVSGAFGTRRIVFVDAPGSMRLEFMEQLGPRDPRSDDPGADAPTADLLCALGSATLSESGAAILEPRLHAVWPAAVAGPAFPVQCAPGDNLAVHAAVASAPPGSVLTVEVPGERERGFWGEVLTVAAMARGLAGLVIDGCVRDTAALRARRFPVFSTGVALASASKAGPGSIGEPAYVGGRLVARGDWLVADRDGIVAIGVNELDDVVTRAVDRQTKEAELFDRIRAGATTVELLGLDTGALRDAAHHDGPGSGG